MRTTRKLTLPEPKAVREIHAVRLKIKRRAKKLGWNRYLEQINSRPGILMSTEPLTLKERPKREYDSK